MVAITADGFELGPVLEVLHNVLVDERMKRKLLNGVLARVILTLKNIQGKQQSWLLDLKHDGTIEKVDQLPEHDVQLLLTDGDFIKLANGFVSGQELFMKGGLKVKGDLNKATALETMFKALDPRPNL